MAWRAEVSALTDATPTWINGVPHCEHDEACCRQYDGKRCRLMGSRPDGVCEPVVRVMADRMQAREGG